MDEIVQRAEVGHALFNEACQLLRLRDIGADEKSADVRCRHAVEGRFSCRLILYIVDDDRCAELCEMLRDPAADPAGTAGHERNLAIERTSLRGSRRRVYGRSHG